MIEKYGFSVVAASRVTVPSSTAASSESCWVLENRCTSSMNSTVSSPPVRRTRRASSITARTSLTPALSADSAANRRSVACATRWAIVVLPVPGGPQRITEVSGPPVTSRRSGAPGASRWSCPTRSSTPRGRIRTASGASAALAVPATPDARPRRRRQRGRSARRVGTARQNPSRRQATRPPRHRRDHEVTAPFPVDHEVGRP